VRLSSGAACLLGVLATGCLHSRVVSQPMTDMERTRASAGAEEGARLAPQQFRHAEDLRAAATEAGAKGDLAGADLLAERALVAYQRALLLARAARATTAMSTAQSLLDAETLEAERLAAARLPFDQQADTTATALAVARDALAPVRSGPVDPAREKARVVAARSLAAEGRLLCGAARLLAPTISGLESATHDCDAVESRLSSPAPTHADGAPAPIDAAARARAGCLSVLTRARRADTGPRADDADALLAELSAHGGWDPSRDERGIVVTLRGAYQGGALTPAADRELKELARVSASHAGFPLQVVLHDATPPTEPDRAVDTQRAATAVAVLSTTGGGAAPRVATELPGASLPVGDPTDPKARARNARLEVVFVSKN